MSALPFSGEATWRLRHQLAAYSPIPAAAVVNAVASAVGARNDLRPMLRNLLLREYAAGQCVLSGSGTQALQLAIMMLREKVGSTVPVALPAFGCFDIASAAVGAGGPVALYDVDPHTLGPDESSLEQVLLAGARIVVVAPLYGVPIAWDALESRAARHGALLVEDASQGHGASWRGRALGSFGAVSTLSFGRGKGWTGGCGGAVLTREGSVFQATRPREAGTRREVFTLAGLMAQTVLGRPELYGIPRSIPALGLGKTVYRRPSPPASMTRGTAAALMRTREVSWREAVQRQETAAMLLGRLAAADRVVPVAPPDGGMPGYLRLPLRVAGGMDGLRRPSRARVLGIASSYPSTLDRLPALRRHLIDAGKHHSGAELLVRDLITVPTHSLLSAKEREEIVDVLVERRP
jgi:dTDP-4-amino-4,6-dideoxygalactose transaminase